MTHSMRSIIFWACNQISSQLWVRISATCSTLSMSNCQPPEGKTRAGILPGCPSLDRESRDAEVGFEPRSFQTAAFVQEFSPFGRKTSNELSDAFNSFMKKRR
ncbi:hypothetical protein T265_06046 [Opisthorchis viverrini]|uniref:Uncharacterized protein n=1 Tax=Opisthorchis viverrini TaxID=6198 RepID=A0A075AEI9_OPIVI|nr:hypothetical protein T265_06046 [Opisthorchis viverrini]KER26764.1 hypothetical protein T265_06046 [Opisthorchis viverrini]